MRVFKIKFGMSGDNVDAFGLRFYGDFAEGTGGGGSFSEIFSDPDIPPLSEHKRITIWFIFEKIKPYEKVSDLLRELTSLLKTKGYAPKVSSIDGLVDTTSRDYNDKPERSYAKSYRIHGCNAANGFSITAENTDAKPIFTQKDISVIQELTVAFGRKVYGRTLKMVDVKNQG